MALLEVRDLSVRFETDDGVVRAVDGVSYSVEEGRSLGILVEAVRAHHDVSKRAARDRSVEMLQLVGIPEPRSRVDAYPHEFSGGMRQRAMIAMALINQPKLLIADEPTTALDVTVQAQILDVIQKLQEEL